MIAARNARRRARGEPEVTTAEYELRVAGDIHEQIDGASSTWRIGELDQLLEATNAQRRKRGPSRAHPRAGSRRVRRRAAGGELNGSTAAAPRHSITLARCLIIGCGCRARRWRANWWRAATPCARRPAIRPRPRYGRRGRGDRRRSRSSFHLALAFEHVDVRGAPVGSATGPARRSPRCTGVAWTCCSCGCSTPPCAGSSMRPRHRRLGDPRRRRARVRAFCEDSRIPHALLQAPRPTGRAGAADAVDNVLRRLAELRRRPAGHDVG